MIDETSTQNATRKLMGTAATQQSLNCSRWKLWDLCRNDSDFPNPRTIAGKNQWFEDEVEHYKASRPERQYEPYPARPRPRRQYAAEPQ